MLSRTKEFQRLLKRVGEISDGQACIKDVDWDNGSVQKFKIVLRPKTGLYKGGAFVFSIRQPESAQIFPLVECLTPIYHPNINTADYRNTNNVCLNVFSINTAQLPLEALVHGLIFLLNNPNLDSQLVSIENEDGDMLSDEEFNNAVMDYMAGKEVMGHVFETGFVVKDGITVSEDISRFLDRKEDETSGKECATGDTKTDTNNINKPSAGTIPTENCDHTESRHLDVTGAAENIADDDADDSYEMLGLIADDGEIVLAIKDDIHRIGNQVCACAGDVTDSNMATGSIVTEDDEELPPRKRLRLDKFFSTGQNVPLMQTPVPLLNRNNSFVKTASESFQSMLSSVFSVK